MDINKKREEIRELLDTILKIAPVPMDDVVNVRNTILETLNVKGCALKVDRELPALECEEPALDKYKLGLWYGASKQLNLFKEAGYEAVEPLIEE